MDDIEVRKLLSFNLKRLRKQKGLSQLALANNIGLAHNFINDIENGKKWVSPLTIAKLAEVLESEPYQFFLPAISSRSETNTVINAYIDELTSGIIRLTEEFKKEKVSK